MHPCFLRPLVADPSGPCQDACQPGPHKGKQDLLSHHCPENAVEVGAGGTHLFRPLLGRPERPWFRSSRALGPQAGALNFPLLVLIREAGAHWDLEPP